MARRKNKARAGGKPSKWIIAGLCLLGLVIGAVVGFYVHYYVLNPAPRKKSVQEGSATTKTTNPVNTANTVSKNKYNKPGSAEPARVQQTMSYLSQQVGARVEGSQAEHTAAYYLKGELEKLGYSVGVQEFTLPNGQVSQDLVTADPGTSDKYSFLIGAHVDSRSGSPGANENASGCAALLELARTIKGTKHVPEIRFVVFGAEEDYGSNRTLHRIGSTNYLNSQSAPERAKIIGMLSEDTISVGPEVHVRDWGANSPGLARSIVSVAQAKGVNAVEDPSENSDHEPFGAAGIPAVWLERMLPQSKPDPALHSSSDSMAHVSTNLVTELVDLTRGYLLGLDEAYCRAAVAR
jgi:hypothetical protein